MIELLVSEEKTDDGLTLEWEEELKPEEQGVDYKIQKHYVPVCKIQPVKKYIRVSEYDKGKKSDD